MKTKSLLKTLLALVALMTCLGLAPKTTWAQQHSVPYGATVIAGYIPQDWVTSNNYGPIPYNGLDYYAFSTGIIVLPELDAPTNTLTVDVNIQPFVNPVYGSIFRIGYVTDVNDLNTFHEIQDSWYMYELPWEGDIRCKRAVFSGVPENARIAFVTIYEWFIQSVLVYETPDPFDVPYSLPSFQSGVGQNEGWMINNYVSYYQYFRDGTALLPVFNSATNLLQLDISMKPYDSYAQSVEVGYVTGSNNNFTTLQTFNNTSSWTDYLPKRISFSNAPSGARMAVRCNGNWQFNNVSVYNPSSTTYTLPYTHSFGATLPGGWLLNNYGYTSGTAYLTSGIAVLPQFQNYTSQTLIFDIAASPKDSNAQNIKIGYITNPNDASTFTEIETFYKTSSWTEFQPKRTLTSLPANARLAVQCDGDWNVRDVSVRIDPGTSLWPTQTAPYHLSTFGNNQPDGWLANNYVNNGVFRTGTSLLPNIHSAFTLNSFYIDIDVKPTTSNNNQTLNIGYVTTSSGQTTFHSLETIYSSSDWTDFRIKRLDYDGVPSGARMALSFGGEWEIRDVLVYPTPSPMAVPYSPTLGESQPQDWLANNYDNGCLKDGLAVLPRFDAEISTLLLDVAIMPKNTSATNIKIGYVTNPNDPSTFVATHTFINSSWNDYLPKRMQFVSAPTGARMAIQCNGDWNIAGVSVKSVSDVQSVFDVPYNLPMTYTYPEGWIANNCSYTSNGFCFNSGTAVLPQFNATLSTLQMDIQLTPASGAQIIQIGYVTNPNNPSATFVALQTFNNSSTWNHPLKRVSFYGLNDNVRLAIKCNGTWMVSLLTVYIEPTPLDVPYYNSNNDGWIENISYHDYYMYPLYQSGCAILPRFNAPIGALQLQISFHTWDSDTHNLSIGYIINPNDLSTFTALQTHTASSTGNNWVNETISYFGVPTNARMAFVCEGTWAIGVAVTMPSISIPYTQGFEGMDVGSIPNGWYAPDMSVQGTYNSIAPHGGTKQLAGKGYIVLPVVENADYSALTLSLYARPEMTNYGGRLRVGYIPNGGALSQFVEIKNVTWNTNLSDYQQISASLAGIPTDARLTLYCFGYSSTANLWHLDDISIKPAETIPYTQPFATNSAPDGWSTYVGHYQESTHTANLTPNTGNSWHFGEANGVFDSHAYATLGDASSNECRWLISPPISLGEANGVFLSFDIAMSRESGNQVPLTPGEQENQRIFVLVTNDGGATWNEEMGWCGQMCGLPDLNVLNPDGNTYYHPLGNYQGQTIQVAFYAECFNGNDNNNRVHIDNVNVQSHDVTGAPTSVTVSEVGGHSAKVSWTPASSMQYHWDLWVPDYGSPYNGITIEYMQGNGYYQHLDGYLNHVVTGLEPNDTYRAWVRYNDGITVGEWASSDWFDTESMCAVPTNLQVIVTQHTALFTWDPGQSNQTSWYTYCDAVDDIGGDTVTEPFRLVTGFEYNPDFDWNFYVIGYCENGDGMSNRVDIDFNLLPPPSLTANDDDDTNDDVPITNDNCGSKESRTQFIIPASQLIDMQYSHLQSLTFESGYIGNGQPWGEDASFKVYLKVVSQNDFSDGEFYDWDELYCIGSFRPTIHNHLMTFSLDDYHQFYYTGGNLLVGFYQEEYDFTPGQNFGHVDWLGVNNYNSNPNYKPSIYYNIFYEEPFAQTFAPKVTFTYEPDAFMPPTNLVVYVTAPDQVTLTWTPREGQTATDVQLLDEDMEPIGTPWNWGGGNVFGLANLDPGTTYNVSIRGLYVVDGENQYSAWTVPVEFTTLDLCDAPENLQANEVGPFTATLTWDSNAEYDEVEYRDANHMNVEFENGFETGSLPEGWNATTSQLNPSQNTVWAVVNDTHGSSTYSIKSEMPRYPGSTVYYNRISFPVASKKGVLTFWAKKSTDNGTFHVQISDDNSTFTNVQQVSNNELTNMYKKFTIDLSGQDEGTGYIAFVHNSSRFATTVFVDDVVFETYDDWTSLGYVEGGQYDFEGLTPGTTYQVRVRSMCELGDATYPGYWTAPVSFSTPGNIEFEDGDVKEVCVTNWDTNNDGELSYAEAAAITDLTLIFKDQVEMQYFNELQYFTGLTAIGDNAFSGCVNLSAITLPPTITSIGNYAFGYSVDNLGYPVPCSSLQSIVIPPSVTTIGYYAFSRSGLTEVILPPSVTSIGTLAFGDCDNLEYVYLPASVTSIEGNAFTGTSIWTIEVDQENPVYDSRGGCNAIIQTDINKLITGCKSTVIPDDVVSIGVSAFENATGLTTINLPSSVESIGEYAFANCSGLTTIYVERPLPPTIYGNTFLNMVHSNVTVNVLCGALTDYRNAEIWSGLNFNYVDPCNIVFADANVKAICVTNWDTNGDGELSYTEAEEVTNIGTVFRDNTSITSFNELQYFTGLVGLTTYAFEGCSQLTSIILPNSIIITTNGTFSGCSSLTSVTLSSSLQRIANSMFQDCSALTYIDIPATVTTIGQDAFKGCSSLTSIVIPASTTTIYNSAFNNCHSLQSIVVEPENTVYDSRNACNAIIKTETNELVIGCDNTEIPDDVVTIGANAFYGRSQMTTIVLPASVTSIGSTAFMGCGGVMEMHVNATTPPSLGNGVFGGSPAAVNPSIPVYVPCESIEAYQNATGWSSFTNYQVSDVFICFADPAVKALCVQNWDANGDGQLSYAEAAAVTTLNPSGEGNNSVFKGNTTITSFDELQYFTGLSVISLYAFQNCTALTSVTLPPTVTKIEYEAFMNCGLTGTLTLPDAVTTIEQDAFSYCRGLTGLVIGSGVTSIGSLAFYNCTGLESIIIEAVNPPALGVYNPFNLVPENIPVYVPCGSKAAYQAADGWSEFTNYLGEGCSQESTLVNGWNWWAPTVEMDLDDLETGLGTNGLLINSQDGGFARNEVGEGWSGTLSEIEVGKMYKIETSSACTLSVQGDRPATVTVTIVQGYNWFGFIGEASMDVSDLDIDPENGDTITDGNGNTATFGTTGWTGQLEMLEPGHGYIYYSNSSTPKTMILNVSSI